MDISVLSINTLFMLYKRNVFKQQTYASFSLFLPKFLQQCKDFLNYFMALSSIKITLVLNIELTFNYLLINNVSSTLQTIFIVLYMGEI